MAPLIVLLSVFISLLLINRYRFKNMFSRSSIGRIALSAMLLVTSIAHFTHADKMADMLPDFTPAKVVTVYLTGLIEIAAAIGLLIPKLAKLTAILLIIFLILILPANIIGSKKQIDIGGMKNGLGYLYFRIPLQILFIWWAYYFGIRKLNKETQV